MDNIFSENAKNIKIYLALASIDNPINKHTTIVYQNSIPIKAIVVDLAFSQIQWKLPGITVDKAKELTIEKKHRTLIENSYKIEIQGETDSYEGWKVNHKMQIREEGDYIRVYIYRKQY